MTDAARNYLDGAAELQPRPISDAQWADAVEAYQRAKLMKDAVDDLVKAFAQQSAQIRFAFDEAFTDHNNDRNAALRLCALRVAAMIGEGME